MIKKIFLVNTLLFLLVATQANSAVYFADLESGAVFQGYNDVRIPGDSGTKFSLTDDLKAEPEFFYRARIGFYPSKNHYISFLAAPLTVESSGKSDRNISFNGTLFPAGTDLKATFRFDSYRLTYRYMLLTEDSFILGIGLTGKIRDASIRLEGGGLSAEKKNTGFVPLISFMAEWKFSGRLGLIVDGDALAAPQGRAEDIQAALFWDVNDNVRIRAGYRMLEGGADNKEVYTFSMFHYAILGITVKF